MSRSLQIGAGNGVGRQHTRDGGAIDVTRLRVKSLHPIPALLETVAEQNPAVFVFGPDRARMMRLRYWRAARAIRAGVTTLVWMAA